MATVREVYERRRKNLRKLIDERFEGVDRAFSRKSGISASYLSKLFGPDDSPETRRLGDDKARETEVACNLPVGWLDTDHETNDPQFGGHALKVRPLMILKSEQVMPFVRRGKEPPDPEYMAAPAADLGLRAFAFRISGDAMVAPAHSGMASLPSGTVVVADPQRAWQSGSLVLCVMGRNSPVVCRRYLESDTGAAVLVALNPAFGSEGVPVGNDNRVIATVTQTAMKVGLDGMLQTF